VNADSGPAWAAWTTVVPVAVGPAARERYVRVPIPFSIAPDADGAYPGLRVIDANGTEVPYAIDPARSAPAPRRLTPIDRGFVERRWTQAVFDLGAGGTLVAGLGLEIDDQLRPTYFERVALDASDDRLTWRVVRDDAIVYRVAQDSGRGDQTIAFAPTRSRWLRVRVLDPRAAFPLDGAVVERSDAPAAGLVRVSFAATPVATAAPHQQSWVFTAPAAIRPAAVAFSDAGGAYARHATVQSSDDGTEWSDAGDAPIARFADGGAQTSFAFGERTARRWRVVVDNGDDPPVAGLQPVLLARRHDLVFAAAPAASYRVLAGNPAATAPAYDLGERLAHAAWRADPATLREPVANASYRDTRPIADRFPWLLSGALALVAAVLGAVALRTVRAARTDP